MSTSSYTPYQPADASTSYAPPTESYSQYPIHIQQFEQLQSQPPPKPKRPETGRIRENISQADSASCINQQVASLAVRRFTTACLKKEGFLTAEPDAMLRLETEVLAFVQQIFGRAKAYSEVAARPHPSALDVVSACLEYDLDMDEELWKVAKRRSKKRKRLMRPAILLPPRGRSPSPELLPSDDEMGGIPPVSAVTLESLPPHLPSLPPKHTYLRTPAPPSKKQALPSLEKKLENATLVQNSLKNLLTLTEDGTDQNDGELFGGVVNWEATKAPRRKWKIASVG